MFTLAEIFLINHVSTLIIGGGLYSSLHTLNKSNIFPFIPNFLETFFKNFPAHLENTLKRCR